MKTEYNSDFFVQELVNIVDNNSPSESILQQTSSDENQFNEEIFSAFVSNVSLVTPCNSGGRPTGSIDVEKRLNAEIYKDTVNNITLRFVCKDRSNILQIIQISKEEYSFLNAKIPRGTIKSRTSRGSLTSRHPGTPLPMEKAELTLVQLMKYCIRFGQELKQTDIKINSEKLVTSGKVGE